MYNSANRKTRGLRSQVSSACEHTLFQKRKRLWFLNWLKEKMGGMGTIRSKRSDGVSEYTIVGVNNVVHVLQLLEPKLRLKKEQANLVLKICEQIPLIKNNKQKFFILCELVDQLGVLNDSKTRRINLLSVKQSIENVRVPVETEIVALDTDTDT